MQTFQFIYHSCVMAFMGTESKSIFCYTIVSDKPILYQVPDVEQAICFWLYNAIENIFRI